MVSSHSLWSIYFFCVFACVALGTFERATFNAYRARTKQLNVHRRMPVFDHLPMVCPCDTLTVASSLNHSPSYESVVITPKSSCGRHGHPPGEINLEVAAPGATGYKAELATVGFRSHPEDENKRLDCVRETDTM